MPKKKPQRADRVVKHTLADGTTRVYRYPRFHRRQKKPTDTLEALIHAYTASPEWNALKPHTQGVYLIYLRPLDRAGALAVKAFRRRDLLEIRDGIAAGRGNGAATGFIRAASALFGWAVDHDWIEQSPAHRIKKLPGGHLRAWTRAEADLAQRALPEHLRRAVVLARYTGQRRGDLVVLPWSAYDGHTIRLTQQKTAAPLVLPCPAALKVELDRWRKAPVATTILTNTLGRPWKPQHLSHELPKGLARIGLAADLGIHGLRKLAAAELADAGCSTHEIAAITGHRTLSMVAHYTRSADQERLAGAAVVKLAAWTKADKRGKM